MDEDNEVTRDCNGNILQDGDSVQPINDRKIGGSKSILKQGMVIKNIKLTHDSDLIECYVPKIGKLVLETKYFKKKG